MARSPRSRSAVAEELERAFERSDQFTVARIEADASLVVRVVCSESRSRRYESGLTEISASASRSRCAVPTSPTPTSRAPSTRTGGRSPRTSSTSSRTGRARTQRPGGLRGGGSVRDARDDRGSGQRVRARGRGSRPAWLHVHVAADTVREDIPPPRFTIAQAGKVVVLVEADHRHEESGLTRLREKELLVIAEELRERIEKADALRPARDYEDAALRLTVRDVVYRRFLDRDETSRSLIPTYTGYSISYRVELVGIDYVYEEDLANGHGRGWWSAQDPVRRIVDDIEEWIAGGLDASDGFRRFDARALEDSARDIESYVKRSKSAPAGTDRARGAHRHHRSRAPTHRLRRPSPAGRLPAHRPRPWLRSRGTVVQRLLPVAGPGRAARGRRGLGRGRLRNARQRLGWKAEVEAQAVAGLGRCHFSRRPRRSPRARQVNPELGTCSTRSARSSCSRTSSRPVTAW